MNTPQSIDIKSIRTIYIALILGVAFFLTITISLIYISGPLEEYDTFFQQILLIVSTIMAIISVTSGIIIFKKRTENIQDMSFQEKLNTFRSAMILRAATMEGSGFFFVVCVVLTGSMISMIEALVVLTIMLLYFPTNMRISEEMKLDLREFERMSKN